MGLVGGGLAGGSATTKRAVGWVETQCIVSDLNLLNEKYFSKVTNQLDLKKGHHYIQPCSLHQTSLLFF